MTKTRRIVAQIIHALRRYDIPYIVHDEALRHGIAPSVVIMTDWHIIVIDGLHVTIDDKPVRSIQSLIDAVA
jgi:hypothetical protein